MKLGSVIACAVILSLAPGCSSTLNYTPRADALAPGADVRVSADVEGAGHLTRVRLRAANLPPPGRLAPNGSAFVVWARPNASTPWGRVGALTYDEGGRSGECAVTVPHLAFDLMVTVEVSSDVPAPSDKMVITQRVGS